MYRVVNTHLHQRLGCAPNVTIKYRSTVS